MRGWMQEKWYISHYHPDQLEHYIMDPRARWRKELQNELWRRQGDTSLTKDAQTLFPWAPNLHPWWDFYLPSRGRGVWGESGQTLLLPAAASVQQPSISRRFPCLHTRQHNRPESFAVVLHFFLGFFFLAHCFHAEICSSVNPREWQESLVNFMSITYAFLNI